jgi:hypothetical protein
MDITAAQIETEMEKAVHIIFHIVNKNYIPSIKNESGVEYPGISRIKIYGFNKPEGLQIIYKVQGGQRQEVSKESISFDERKGTVILDKISIPFTEEKDIIFILV